MSLSIIGNRALTSFSELTAREKNTELLRWICVPAAAVLGVLALGLIAGFVMPPALAQLPESAAMPTSDFYRIYLPWIFRILMGAVFVIAGAKTAPRCRLKTAIVLGVLWSLSSLNSHVLVHLSRGKPHYTHFVVEAVAAACGAVSIFYSEKFNGSRQ